MLEAVLQKPNAFVSFFQPLDESEYMIKSYCLVDFVIVFDHLFVTQLRVLEAILAAVQPTDVMWAKETVIPIVIAWMDQNADQTTAHLAEHLEVPNGILAMIVAINQV